MFNRKKLTVYFWHGSVSDGPRSLAFLNKIRFSGLKKVEMLYSGDGYIVGFEYYGTVQNFVDKCPDLPLQMLKDRDTLFTTYHRNFNPR